MSISSSTLTEQREVRAWHLSFLLLRLYNEKNEKCRFIVNMIFLNKQKTARHFQGLYSAALDSCTFLSPWQRLWNSPYTYSIASWALIQAGKYDKEEYISFNWIVALFTKFWHFLKILFTWMHQCQCQCQCRRLDEDRRQRRSDTSIIYDWSFTSTLMPIFIKGKG